MAPVAVEYVSVGHAPQVAPSPQYPGLQEHVTTSVAEPAGQGVYLYALTLHSLQVVQAVAAPPALYVPLRQEVQTPEDRYAPGTHVVETHVDPSRVYPALHPHAQVEPDMPALVNTPLAGMDVVHVTQLVS